MQDKPVPAKEIPLTQGKVAIVDAADYEWLSQWKWYAHATGNTIYARRDTTKNHVRRRIFMHSLLTGAPMTDHVDGNGLNNRRGNLRAATTLENNRNQSRHKDGSSQFKGVSLFPWGKRRKRWVARIKFDGRARTVGYFATQEEAACAYDDAATAAFGKFAKLNFPNKERHPQ